MVRFEEFSKFIKEIILKQRQKGKIFYANNILNRFQKYHWIFPRKAIAILPEF